MHKLSQSQRDYLWAATKKYSESLPGSPAAEYLESRGIPPETKFGLGYVTDALPGHEMYVGCLAIPYLRYSQWRGWFSASIRFRRLDDSKPKYLTTPGDKTRLFNTHALTRHSPDICITEGEIDAITAHLAGLPAVGVPGAQAWKPYFREPFLGYRTVNILADGDDAGMQFARHVAGTLHNARIIPMPEGQDVNSFVLEQGKEALLERIG